MTYPKVTIRWSHDDAVIEPPLDGRIEGDKEQTAVYYPDRWQLTHHETALRLVYQMSDYDQADIDRFANWDIPEKENRSRLCLYIPLSSIDWYRTWE